MSNHVLDDLGDAEEHPDRQQRDASVRAAREATLRLIQQARGVLDELQAHQRQLEELLNRLNDQVEQMPEEPK